MFVLVFNSQAQILLLSDDFNTYNGSFYTFNDTLTNDQAGALAPITYTATIPGGGYWEAQHGNGGYMLLLGDGANAGDNNTPYGSTASLNHDFSVDANNANRPLQIQFNGYIGNTPNSWYWFSFVIGSAQNVSVFDARANFAIIPTVGSSMYVWGSGAAIQNTTHSGNAYTVVLSDTAGTGSAFNGNGSVVKLYNGTTLVNTYTLNQLVAGDGYITFANYYGNGGYSITQINGLYISLLPFPPGLTLTWDNGAATGNWNTTDTNWSGSTWSNSDNAVFGPTGVGAVTLTEPITAQSITFNTAGYTLTGGQLILNGTQAVTNNADATIATPITLGALSKQGSGTLTLSGTNTYTSATVINGGELYANAPDGAFPGALSQTASITVNNGGTLGSSANGLFGWTADQAGTTTVNTGGVMTLDDGADVNVLHVTLAGGTLTGIGSDHTGYGSWVFRYGQVLEVTDNSTVSALDVFFKNGSSIDVVGGKNLNFSGTLIDTAYDNIGALIKTGAGTLTLAGINTYTGGTTNNAGTLLVNGSIATGVTVAGGTLGGSGTIGGAVTVNSGATLTAGAVPGTIGTLTINGSLTLNGNVQVELNKSLAPSNSVFIVTGGLTNLGTGTLTVSNLGPALVLGDKFILFSGAVTNGAALTLVPPAGYTLNNNLAVDGSISVVAPAKTTVHWTNVFQHIDGFGASSAWDGSWTTNQADMFFSTNSGTGTSVDGTTNFAFNGIGLSLLRSRIAPDGTTIESSIMQMAQARGARVWSTPWSPPAIYKSTNSVNGGSFVSSPAHYQGYANQLAGYVAAMKTNYGVNLYAVSIQNEPDESATYESCLWTAQQIHDFVPYLAAALTNAGVASTRIMLLEDSNWDLDYNLATTAMSDPSTAAQVGIVAAHDYSFSYAILNNYGKPLWETEMSSFEPYDGSIDNGLHWANQIHNLLTIGQVNAWHYWWLIPGIGDNESLVGPNGLPAKRMYAVGQFSRFIRPGYYRIGADNNGALSISAYKDPASGNFAIVTINNNAWAFTQTFDLAGFNCVRVTPWITSGTLSLAAQPAINLTNASFTCTLPAASVVTFVGQAIPTNSTTFTGTFIGNNLILSWPADHTGWTLLTQINNLNKGVSAKTNDWVRLPNSATTNQVVIPMNSNQSGGYFRLVYP